MYHKKGSSPHKFRAINGYKQLLWELEGSGSCLFVGWASREAKGQPAIPWSDPKIRLWGGGSRRPFPSTKLVIEGPSIVDILITMNMAVAQNLRARVTQVLVHVSTCQGKPF